MKNINSKELKELIITNPETVILDVRTEGEVQSGMIEGAENMNIMSPDFANRVKALDKDKTYVVVCRSGNRSASACGFMEHAGFQKVYNLSGGMTSWTGDVVVQ